MMKYWFSILLLFGIYSAASAQGAQTYFNSSASHYVHGRNQQAIQTLSEGLKKYPNDPKLKELLDKMKEEEKKKQEEQKQKDQQQKEQEKKDQQQKEQQQKEQEKKDQQQKEQQNPEQKENQDKKKPNPELSEKLEQMKISEQKARMILEAMKNQEIQYLQQNKRKASKPKDKGKPDW
jgi:cell division protein FtsN